MQKQAPSIGRILVAIGFALSCFGLILFLWIAFGGPIPLKPKSYEITAYFPEATQLATESDVRIGGVSVGKVKSIELAPEDKRVDGHDTTEATIQIDPEFAPINSDARAILRQKTLLGETYVELTSGTKPGEQAAPVSLGSSGGASDSGTDGVEAIAEGGTLGVGQTKDATQIDEIFNALDKRTRSAFQEWQKNAAVAINGRSVDLNDSLGNLGPFLSDATSVLKVLRSQRTALLGLVRDTGTVFGEPGAGRGDHQLQPDLRRAGSRGPRPGRDLPHPAGLRARVAPHARAARHLPGQYAAADPEAPAGGERHLADAALSQAALAASRVAVPEAEAADQGVEEGPAGDSRVPDGLASCA
jgi:hypothetical protein